MSLEHSTCIGRVACQVFDWIRDLLAVCLALLLSPIWLTSMCLTGKIRTDWKGRFGRISVLSRADKPRLLVHAVSVGEVNAIREFVTHASTDWEVVISTTTNTGFARAQSLYAQNHHVLRYPFDFHFAVRPFLRAVSPDAVTLVELEVWPAFLRQCVRRRIPVVVVNGRISRRSFARYRRLKWLIRHEFEMLAGVCAQDEEIAGRFVALGARRESVHVMGTMKWDTARLENSVSGAQDLAVRLGIDRSRPIVVAGSTGQGEEALIHNAVPRDVQLLIAPRKPERFHVAAAAIPGCVRWSQPESRPLGATRFLLDTLGELQKAYSLADLIIIGRTFSRQGGSDMIEAVALGKAVIVGPDVSAFEVPARVLLASGGLAQTDVQALPDLIRQLLGDPARRRSMAEQGRAVIRAHQGATARQVEFMRRFAPSDSGNK